MAELVVMAGNERWIAGYKGIYSVDTEGAVFSWNYGRSGQKRKLKGKVNHDGYLHVGLYRDGKRKTYQVHRLVAVAFLDNPEDKPEVNHVDGNKQKNTLVNLEFTLLHQRIFDTPTTQVLTLKLSQSYS